MSSVTKRTFSLPAEHARFIDDQVASGAYASGSEVVRAGIRALQERDAAVERWLREEVAPAYDAMKADPSRAIPAKKVFAKIRAHHATRLKAARRERRRVVFAPEAQADLISLYNYIEKNSGARARHALCRAHRSLLPRLRPDR